MASGGCSSGSSYRGEGEGNPPTPSTPSNIIPLSPLEHSIHNTTMDKNKESLKVKLMMRRPINELVGQGILPPLKTPPAYAEQRQRLERAKMGDLLKAKIQRRPDRMELVRQHILEDTGKVDPSLAERQRMLKKARLADSLNDQLSHRPGPLELIQKNILHTDEDMERAIKEGQILFRATCEGQAVKPTHPNMYITYDEDSSSEGAQSPLQETMEQHAPPTPKPPPVPVTIETLVAPSPSLGSMTSSLSPLSSIASPPSVASPAIIIPQTITLTTAIVPTTASFVSRGHSGGVSGTSSGSLKSEAILRNSDQSRHRKKSKSKAQPKARTIKFHEYKGPPSAHKSSPPSGSNVESSYELLLQQQQLFLQWQLQLQHKYPQIILPAAQKPPVTTIPQAFDISNKSIILNSTTPNPPPPPPIPTLPTNIITFTTTPSIQPQSIPMPQPPLTPQSPPTPSPAPSPAPLTTCGNEGIVKLGKLEDMKVIDLKMELKKRNLPVSGSKPQLIERLKPFIECLTPPNTPNAIIISPSSVTTSASNINIQEDTFAALVSDSLSSNSSPPPIMSIEDHLMLPPQTPSSPASVMGMDMDFNDLTSTDIAMDTSEGSPPPLSISFSPPPHTPPPFPQPISEEIIQQQQRRIEELQRELQQSQQMLKAIRQKEKESSACLTTLNNNNSASMNKLTPADNRQHQRLVLQQHLQNRKQQQQLQNQLQTLLQLQTLQQQQQKGLPTNTVQLTNICTGVNKPVPSPPNHSTSTDELLQLQQAIQQQEQSSSNNATKKKQTLTNGVAGHHRSGSLPNFFGTFLQTNVGNTTQLSPLKFTMSVPSATSANMNSVATSSCQPLMVTVAPVDMRTTCLPQLKETEVEIKIEDLSGSKPPPQYEEATKSSRTSQMTSDGRSSSRTNGRKYIKSQVVDDVLDILIQSGELPPSAAQDPTTPTTPGNKAIQTILFKSTPPPPNSSPPPPPPPPPLPPITFAITLPTVVPFSTASNTPHTGLASDTTFAAPNTPSSIESVLDSLLASSSAPQQPVPITTNTGLDLGDLGVDLDCLDVMDLSQLESDALDTSQFDVNSKPDFSLDPCPSQLIDGLDLPDMQMDMDVSEWLETFMLPNSPPMSMSTMNTGYQPNSNNSDPMLATHHDPFDLFSIDDMEMKTPTDLVASIPWDRVDFTV